MLSILGTKDDGIVTDAYKSTEMLKENAINSRKFKGIVFDNAEHDFDGFEDRIVKEILDFVKE